MILLTEENFEHVEILTEEVNGKKNYYIEGVFMQSMIKNRNGRLYPQSTLKKEVDRYIKEYVETNRAVGELGHPDSPNINYDRTSHKILSLKEDKNNYIGKARVIATPMGKIVKTLIDEGIKFGVSSRGLGTLKMSEGANVVQNDFHLATPADIVYDPSAPDAFVTGLMEKKEWVWGAGGQLVEADLTQMENEIRRTRKADLEKTMLQVFTKFIQKL